jgi:hypothetical protein
MAGAWARSESRAGLGQIRQFFRRTDALKHGIAMRKATKAGDYRCVAASIVEKISVAITLSRRCVIAQGFE